MIVDDILKFINEHKNEIVEFSMDGSTYTIKLCGWIIHGNIDINNWTMFYVYSSIDRSKESKLVIEFMRTVYEYYKDSYDFMRIYRALQGTNVYIDEFYAGKSKYRIYSSIEKDLDYTNVYRLFLVLNDNEKETYNYHREELQIYKIQTVLDHKKSRYFPSIDYEHLNKHEEAIKIFCKDYLGYVPSWRSITNWNTPDDKDKFIRIFRGALGDKFTIKRVLPNKCYIRYKGSKEKVCEVYITDSGFWMSSPDINRTTECEEIKRVLELLHIYS